jgi:hypothetical protein
MAKMRNSAFHILPVLWKVFEYESKNVFRSGNNIVILPFDIYFRSSQYEILKYISDNQHVSQSSNDELNVFERKLGLVN